MGHSIACIFGTKVVICITHQKTKVMGTKPKLRAFAFLIAFSIISTVCFGQVEVKWSKELPGKIMWQEVTALGNLIVCTDEALLGVNTETGNVTWRNGAFANLRSDAYRELTNSPFFTVTTNTSIHLLDQFSGDEVFNSKKAGIKIIDSYFLLYNSDAILVAGKDPNDQLLMLSVKMSTGGVSWSMNEKFGRIVAANELGNNELLIVTLFNNYKLNAGTGKIIWKEVNSKEAAQTEKLGAFGDLLKTAAENMSKDMDIQLDFYRPEGGDVFYLGSQKQSQSSMTTSSGEPTINYTNNYNAYKISDGSLVWKNNVEMQGKLGYLVFRDNGFIVLPDDGNRTKINMFDYQTGTGQWGKKGKGIAIKGGIYDYLDSGDGILLVSRTANNDFLNYLDSKTGVITFEKPVKVEGSVVGIVALSNSILYITTESMNILDPTTGMLKWKKSIQTTPSLTAEHDGKIYAYDTRSGLLNVVDKQTTEVKELSYARLEFQGKESPQQLEVMADGIFLHSDQNVAKFNVDGTLKFMQYYPAPREEGWKRALLYASAVRAAYIGAASYYVSGSLAAAEGDVRKEDAAAGEMVSQIGAAYGQLGDAASKYAGTAFKQANARKKATLAGRDFMFMMSKEDNIVLLKVSKLTGKADGKINLGKDREPNYAVDDITSQVYYQTADNKLTSYIVH